MKMVKKILLGLVATATLVGFASCKMSDDEENAIKGSGNDKEINHTNESENDSYRAYISTNLKHAGALVKITFEEPSNDNFSKMGVIFGLHDSKNVNDAVDFYIIGLAGTDKCNFYVSKFENITNLQGKNFGALINATGNNPKETVYVNLNQSTIKTATDITLPSKAEDGSISVYVYYKALKNGKYEWAVLDFTDEEAKKTNLETFDLTSVTASKVLKHGEIDNAFDEVTDAKKVPQDKIAVYAMVSPKKTLKGKWHFSSTYLAAEEIAE